MLFFGDISGYWQGRLRLRLRRHTGSVTIPQHALSQKSDYPWSSGTGAQTCLRFLWNFCFCFFGNFENAMCFLRDRVSNQTLPTMSWLTNSLF